jgi:predicted transcriptional regulator of viral defense system/very-short-patch-repair endonuclease
VETLDAQVSRIAEAHHGVFAAHHLRALEVSRHVRTNRLASGRWARVHEDVYRIVGTPLSWRGRLLAACWAGGTRAAASHRSAAELGELPGRNGTNVEITCPRWKRARHDGLIVHESLEFEDVDITTVNRIPVTTTARTLFDLARVVSQTTVDLAMATALRRRLTTLEQLDEVLGRLASRGRAGTTRFRTALELHHATPAKTESEAEHLVLRLVEQHGLPTPVPQFEIRRADGTLAARVDFAYPDLKIAIEYDSYAHHLGTDAHDRDGARRNAIVKLGWLPITATAADLRNGGHRLAADISEARTLRTGVEGAP